MKKSRLVCILIMIGCLILVTAEYFFARNRSYTKYLSGEYFFREAAYTVNIHMNDNWWATDQAQNMDHTDPKNLLKLSNNAKVYVSNPHDGLCTVNYGKDTVIEDYPLADLRLDCEDTGYFYGTKKYTLKEYTDKLKSMSKDELKSYKVSDKRMADYIGYEECVLMVLAAVAGVSFIGFILYKSEMDFGVDLTLVVGTGLVILYSILTVMINYGA